MLKHDSLGSILMLGLLTLVACDKAPEAVTMHKTTAGIDVSF